MRRRGRRASARDSRGPPDIESDASCPARRQRTASPVALCRTASPPWSSGGTRSVDDTREERRCLGRLVRPSAQVAQFAQVPALWAQAERQEHEQDDDGDGVGRSVRHPDEKGAKDSDHQCANHPADHQCSTSWTGSERRRSLSNHSTATSTARRKTPTSRPVPPTGGPADAA